MKFKYHYKASIYSDSGNFLRNAEIISDICLYWILREDLFLLDMDGNMLKEHIGWLFLQRTKIVD